MNGTEPNEPWWIELFEMYYLGCYGDVCRYRRTRNLYVSLYFFFFLFSLSVSTLCQIAFRKAMRYIMNSNGSEQNKVIFTHPTECRRVWLRGLGDWLNSSPYSRIFNLLCVSGFQASLLFIFLHNTTYGTKHICVLHFRDRRGAASLHHRFRAATTILLREQKPSLVWFSWRSRSCPVSEYEHSLIEILKYSDHIRSLLCYWCLLVVFALFLLEIIPKSLI